MRTYARDQDTIARTLSYFCFLKHLTSLIFEAMLQYYESTIAAAWKITMQLLFVQINQLDFYYLQI